MSPALAVRGTGKFGWGSLLSSGDFDFITSASGTAVSSISIDNCFSAGYDHYLVLRNVSCTAANIGIQGRLRVGGVDSSAANYRYQYLYATSTTVAAARDTGQQQWIQFLGNTELTSYGYSRTWISNPFAAVRTTAWVNNGYGHPSNIECSSWVYENDATTSYDGFTVFVNGQTITGSIYVYGLAV